ncbi:hypothetical protein [Streptomyces sp. NPDC051173]|uniref:hypothetical protein n=1 Tax=Streptomyces sp. NPDC051173 TaxID=3155164 RepID=UPI00344C1880
MSARRDGAPLCLCGHRHDQHNSPTALGGVQCRACPVDDARSWRHLYTPDDHPVAAGTGCYGPHCAATDTLDHIRALTAELAEQGGGCLWQCGATQIADRILAALNTTPPEDT